MLRKAYIERIAQGFETSSVVAILGPRQCGKTTLARDYFGQHKGVMQNYFDLEDPNDLARLQDPMLGLESLKGLIVIDEIQRIPDLFPVIRVLVDRPNSEQRYLILGSASRELIRQSSESLAGRIHFMELTPFSYGEVDDLDKLWLQGGFPRSYLAESTDGSVRWRRDYIRTFLEQDIPNLGLNIPADHLRRFWMMLAHYHGQVFNASEIGGSLGFSHHTMKKYLDILTGTFMVRQLTPWYENINKRQVKTPKIYFRDSGLYHTLLNINQQAELVVNPKLGASWEGFALEAVIRHLKVDKEDCYFWAVHNQAEVDLLIVQGMDRVAFEFKYNKSPTLTKSMQSACELLGVKRMQVIYPGEKNYPLSKKIECVGLKAFLSD